MSPKPEPPRAQVFGEDGWVSSWIGGPGEEGAWLSVRFAETDTGRLRPVEVHIASCGGVDTGLLAKLGLRGLEAWANMKGGHRDYITAKPLETVAPMAFVHQVSLGAAAESVSREVQSRRQSLKLSGVKTSGRRPDAFYERVARAYGQLSATSRSPAKTLAEANDVPVSTAHRWIKEARARGLIGPGEKGKAG